MIQVELSAYYYTKIIMHSLKNSNVFLGDLTKLLYAIDVCFHIQVKVR